MNNNSPTQTSPLAPYKHLIGREWSNLEFEQQCHVRRGLREGILTMRWESPYTRRRWVEARTL
jgi:hypothetical protein